MGSRLSGARGSAAVEFALVLPLVLTLTLALLQLGLLAKDQMLVQEASRAGARQASVTGDDATVLQAVNEAAAGLDLPSVSMTVLRGSARGTPVTVQVAYEAPITLPIVGWLLPGAVRLTAAATMRQET
ncbi:MAG TPA: TadE/TadG family type IV pilus assembly protein [Actinomycetota bacterium]|nr:TadE/TadG family type IV pilus assembly protein [Actinomycetota bacterium]